MALAFAVVPVVAGKPKHEFKSTPSYCDGSVNKDGTQIMIAADFKGADLATIQADGVTILTLAQAQAQALAWDQAAYAANPKILNPGAV